MNEMKKILGAEDNSFTLIDEFENSRINEEEISSLFVNDIGAESVNTILAKKIIRQIGEFNGEDIALDIEDPILKTYNELLTMMTKKSIIESTLNSVISDPDTGKVYIVTSFKEMSKILIPDNEFFYDGTFLDSFYSAPVEEQRNREKQLASRMLGARISFIMTSLSRKFDRDTHQAIYVATASRKAASEKLQKYYFFGDEPIVTKGSRCEARVLSVSPYSAKVEVLGVETLMKLQDLVSFKWLERADDEFYPGQKILVDVIGIKKDKLIPDKISEIKLSRKNVDQVKFAENIKKVHPGDTATATVFKVNYEKGTATAIANIGTGVFVSIPKSGVLGSEELRPGDKITVSITSVHYDSGFAVANARKLRIR